MTATTWSQTDLLRELEPVVEENLNRHLSMAKEWFPHEYIPWSDGRNFDGLMGGEPWSPERRRTISDVARSALIVNLLTEDNLPSYHHEIAIIFGRDGAWGEWVHRWTAEEGRHGIAMRDYLLVTRVVDPVAARAGPDEPHVPGLRVGALSGELLRSLAYVSLPGARHPRLAPQHRQVHRRPDVPTSCSPASPRTRTCTWSSTATCSTRRWRSRPTRRCMAVTDVVKGFQMPGTGIPGFQRKAVEMAIAGIYDLRLHQRRRRQPRCCGSGRSSSSRASAPRASRRAPSSTEFMADLEKQALRFEDKRDTLKARMAQQR